MTALSLAQAQKNLIRPGAVWLDNRGQQIQAHGGGILLHKGTYYWFGEDRSVTNHPAKRSVACYASKDLVHWKFRRQVLAVSSVDGISKGLILERPKVFYNATTHKFVLYAHLDGPGYKVARVMVAVSTKVDGKYHFVRSFRPFGQESRDIGQFVDDDGKAYLIFESRPTKGFFIASLSDDYLNVEKEVSFVHAPLEGGALVHYKGLYYVIGSHLTGWRPNPNIFATSPSLAGPWTEFKNIAPPDANTYGSQSSMLLKVQGSEATTVIFMGDIWRPKTLWDSRYLWMPLEIGDGAMHLPPPHPWTLNVKTGAVKILP
ncbi:MAG: family 43 glycosylhydrolase [Acidobacteriaceae bacterium]